MLIATPASSGGHLRRARLRVMINIGMSTSCAYPLSTDDAFRLAKTAGFDGVEVMVTNDKVTQDPAALLALSEKYGMPIFAIHAPVLLLTTFVWGREPGVKLRRSAELAAAVGASSVVVHPPFRFQSGYAEGFTDLVRTISQDTGIEIAVENMFPWKIAGRNLKAYLPSSDPTTMDVDAMTLDFSHASLAGRNSLQLAKDMGDKLRHIHLCDGSGSIDDGKIFDEHLIPGRGNEPVAEVLQMLARNHWSGHVVAEVITRKAKTDAQRLAVLEETVAFARKHLAPDHDETLLGRLGHVSRKAVEAVRAATHPDKPTD